MDEFSNGILVDQGFYQGSEAVWEGEANQVGSNMHAWIIDVIIVLHSVHFLHISSSLFPENFSSSDKSTISSDSGKKNQLNRMKRTIMLDSNWTMKRHKAPADGYSKQKTSSRNLKTPSSQAYPAAPSIKSVGQHDDRTIASIVILKNLGLADEQIQIQALEVCYT